MNFVKREDLLRFLREHNEASFRVAEQLSDKYNTACHEIRALGLSNSATEKFEAIRYASAYPKSAVLFVEGQTPRGIFVLCKGRVKLSIGRSDGKTLIVKIAEPGDVLGLSATISGKPYELTAETNRLPGRLRRVIALWFGHHRKLLHL